MKKLLFLPIFLFGLDVEFELTKILHIKANTATLIKDNNLTINGFKYLKTKKGYVVFGDTDEVDTYINDNLYVNANQVKIIKALPLNKVNNSINQFQIKEINNLQKTYNKNHCVVKKINFSHKNLKEIYFKDLNLKIKEKITLSCN